MLSVNDLYYYDETSPTCLRWAVEVYSGRWKNFKNVSVGDVAGGIGSGGYYQVRKERKLQLVHRVIWEIFNGAIPEGMFIDHIDGNRVNNKISNLRVVKREGNARNSKKRKDNTSGLTGVVRIVNTLRSGNKVAYWRACWIDMSGNNKSKAFNISKYGEDVAYSLAVKERLFQIELLNSEGAGYTKRHTESSDLQIN